MLLSAPSEKAGAEAAKSCPPSHAAGDAARPASARRARPCATVCKRLGRPAAGEREAAGVCAGEAAWRARDMGRESGRVAAAGTSDALGAVLAACGAAERGRDGGEEADAKRDPLAVGWAGTGVPACASEAAAPGAGDCADDCDIEAAADAESIWCHVICCGCGC